MQSLRRAALSSALAAARAVTPKTQAASFLTQLARQSTPQATSVLMVRAFSQSAYVANAEQNSSENSFASPAPTTREDRSERVETDFGVFVRNLVFDANESHLKEIFGKYGEIASAQVGRDARGLSRGYGFIYFNNGEDLQRAIANVDGSFWQGRRLQCLPRVRNETTSKRQRVQEHEPSATLFIGNIPYETSDSELNRLFEGIPNLSDVRVAIDRTTGWPRGFAHADFSDVESAKNALERLQGARLGSRELRLDFAPMSRPKKPVNSPQFDGKESDAF